MLAREISIYLACDTDMRKFIDNFASIVSSPFMMDPHQPSLFPFCGRHKDRIKTLLWDETGFLLLYKVQFISLTIKVIDFSPKSFQCLKCRKPDISQSRNHLCLSWTVRQRHCLTVRPSPVMI
jgi:hypothetical protein